MERRRNHLMISGLLIVVGVLLVGFDSVAGNKSDHHGSASNSAAAPGSVGQAKKKCPACAEFIKLEALVCRFCGHKFERDEVQAEVRTETTRQRLGNRWEDLTGEWRAMVLRGACPHCNTASALETQGAVSRCKACGATFPRPKHSSKITFTCPTCGVSVTPAQPVCPKCGIRVRLSRPA